MQHWGATGILVSHLHKWDNNTCPAFLRAGWGSNKRIKWCFWHMIGMQQMFNKGVIHINVLCIFYSNTHIKIWLVFFLKYIPEKNIKFRQIGYSSLEDSKLLSMRTSTSKPAFHETVSAHFPHQVFHKFPEISASDILW